MAEDSAPQEKLKRGKQGDGGGPKPKNIDPKQLTALAGMQCTYEEIAAVFGIKKRQFIDRLEVAPELREIIEDGWANGRASIRRQQFKMLMEGNATMAVWLGKQYLGQRDQTSIEHAGESGGPVKIIVEYEDRPAKASAPDASAVGSADAPQAL